MMLTSLLKAQTDLRQMSVDYIKQTKNVSFTSAQWLITDQIYDKNTQTTFLYLRQMHAGKEIFNVNVNFSIKNNKVLHMAGTPKKDYSVRSAASGMSAESAIRAAATELNLKITSPLTSSSAANAKGVNVTKFSKAGISQEPIPVKEMYYLNAKNELVSVWNLSIYENSGDNWWDLLVDAQSGQIVNKANWVTHCNFGLHEKNNLNNDDCEDKHVHTPSNLVEKIAACPEDRIIAKKPVLSVATNAIPRVGGNQYNIFPLPIEAPSYGTRSIVQDPESLPASPFGWHDTNGTIGAEFTITRGNNVYAYRDADANNIPDPGSSPDGGATLDFNFPFPTTQEPETYVPASTTNLFYWNNKVHDFYYRYGFDDISGNFQTNNYGRGGLGNDAVNAESQDGSGTNNANFGTPPDGSSPRMQMYLWDSGTPINLLTVNSPAPIAGGYASTPSTSFGLQITATTNITGNMQLMNDGSADPTLGCVASPAGSLTGKIALIDRGSPAASPGLGTFVLKAKNAQNAGAIGVIIVNNVAGAPAGMSGTDATITIPIVMVSQANGLIFKNSLAASNVISATFRSVTPVGAPPRRDASFDNGIIAHEYGHGISTRLTGGPANSGCLQNAEQMGEGWSDFFGLVMTMLPSHTGATPRGIGTYATYQPTTGGGIRPAPYTTNMAINPYTYSGVANTAAISQPHGIGFIWCTMLWEVNWGMIGRYGFDNDLQNGNGGNNKTIQLVLLALKLQPCGPGFVDGRDALLAADMQLFGGANQDIIWIAFSKRGLGLNASQGDPDVRGDGVEDTTVPPQFNPTGCAPGNSKIVLPSGLAIPAEFCEGNVATIGAFGKIFTISTPSPALYDYGYLLAKNGNLFQFNTTGAFNFPALGDGVYTVVGISYKNTNTQTMTAYLTTRIGSSLTSIQADFNITTMCAVLGNNNSTYNAATEITIRSVAYCTTFCKPISGKIKLPTNFPAASAKICEGEPLAIGAFDKVLTVFPFPATAADYDYNYLLTKGGNIFQFNANGAFDFTNLPEGIYTIAGISYKKANPQTISSYLTSRVGTTIEATKTDITAQNTCAEITTTSTLGSAIIITIQSKSVCAITATDPKFRQSVKVFPNPTSQNINVEFTNLPNETLQIVMYNMQGMEVLSQKVNTTTNVSLENISLKNLAKGVYVMKIQMKDKFVMEKIIVN